MRCSSASTSTRSSGDCRGEMVGRPVLVEQVVLVEEELLGQGQCRRAGTGQRAGLAGLDPPGAAAAALVDDQPAYRIGHGIEGGQHRGQVAEALEGVLVGE